MQDKIVITRTKNGQVRACLKESVLDSEFVFNELKGVDVYGILNKLSHEERVILFLALTHEKFMFIDIKKHAEFLQEKCEFFLSNLGVDDETIELLTDNLNYRFMSVTLLGELASFSREEIESIEGVNENTLNFFDKIIYENGLYWEFPIDEVENIADGY